MMDRYNCNNLVLLYDVISRYYFCMMIRVLRLCVSVVVKVIVCRVF